MAIEFSQHRNILERITHMTSHLLMHEHDIDIRIDPFWYMQKADEIRDLQNQIENTAQHLYELRLHLHTESHKIYHKLKADDRAIKKHQQKRKRMAAQPYRLDFKQSEYQNSDGTHI